MNGRQTSPGEFTHPRGRGFVCCIPTAAICNANKFAGEIDVF